MPSWPALSRPQQAAPARLGERQGDQPSDGNRLDTSVTWLRRVIGTVLIGFFAIGPGVAAVRAGSSPTSWFLLAGSVVFFITVAPVVVIWPARLVRISPWLLAAYCVGLGSALFVVGQQYQGSPGKQLNWLVLLALAAAACGRISAGPQLAAAGGGACALVGAAVTLSAGSYGTSNVAIATFVPPLATLFAYSAARRLETLAMLRDTRAELANVAVAGERLRIARDLHDLLGHSLSLITLKAELAGRVLDSDSARAGREIGELESVARQALADVRAAVAGYRQPDLAAELAAARQLLTAAGVGCLISAPGAPQLAPDVDAVLAWTVREGATNIVRHAMATHATFAIRTTSSSAVAEITDDGYAQPASTHEPAARAELPAGLTGPAGNQAQLSGPLVPFSGLAGFGLTGSGLVGLAERVRGLGGELVAGAVSPHGFRLRVTLPLRRLGDGQAA